MARLQDALTPERGLIFRITHRANIPWIVANGLHCKSSPFKAPAFVNIGNAELIGKRSSREVPIPPGGTLSDYVPFYFTPFSPMMLNIHTGRGGVQRLDNQEIVVITSSLPRLAELGVRFVFTDRHAYLNAAEFSSDLTQLDMVDWDLLQRRDFSRDYENPAKFEKYQAEALVHKHLPAVGITAIACYTREVEAQIQGAIADCGVSLETLVRPSWYFT